jgi:hypothetical protein
MQNYFYQPNAKNLARIIISAVFVSSLLFNTQCKKQKKDVVLENNPMAQQRMLGIPKPNVIALYDGITLPFEDGAFLVRHTAFDESKLSVKPIDMNDHLELLSSKDFAYGFQLTSKDKKQSFQVKFLKEELNIDFTSTIQTDQSDFVFIDNDNRSIVLNPKGTLYVKSYQYKIYKKGTSTAVYTSSSINYNQEQEIPININVSQFLTGNNIFNNTDFSISVELTTASKKQSFSKDIKYYYVVESNIPIIDIQVANGVEPPIDKTKLNADYQIFDLQQQDVYSIAQYNVKKIVKGEINARGSGSLTYPKKSFTLTLDDKTEVYDMPSHTKWIIIGTYVDVSHLMNYTTYNLYRQMGHYAVNIKPMVVYVNGNYRGVYDFAEKIEQGSNRVPTKKYVDGGFIVKIDQNNRNFKLRKMSYLYEYPSNPTDNGALMKDVLKKYEDALIDKKEDWRQYMNEEAEIDHFILTDVFANIDGYGNNKNMFYYLNQTNNLLEPIVWDFDCSFGPGFFWSNYNAWMTSWQAIYRQNELIYDYRNTLPIIEDYKKDVTFTRNLVKRYNVLRKTILSNSNIFSIMNPLIEKLEQGKHYNNDDARWLSTYKHGDRFTPNQIKNLVTNRLNILDQKWKLNFVENFSLSGAEAIDFYIENSATYSIANILPSNANEKEFTWEVSPNQNATIEVLASDKVKITFLKEGNFTVRATAKDQGTVTKELGVVVKVPTVEGNTLQGIYVDMRVINNFSQVDAYILNPQGTAISKLGIKIDGHLAKIQFSNENLRDIAQKGLENFDIQYNFKLQNGNNLELKTKQSLSKNLFLEDASFVTNAINAYPVVFDFLVNLNTKYYSEEYYNEDSRRWIIVKYIEVKFINTIKTIAKYTITAYGYTGTYNTPFNANVNTTFSTENTITTSNITIKAYDNSGRNIFNIYK